MVEGGSTVGAEAAGPGRPRRIAFVVNALFFLRSHRLALVTEARARGWEVHVVSGPPVDPKDFPAEAIFRELGCTVHQVAFSRAGTGPLELLGTVLGLRRIYRGVRPDLVHHISPKMVTLGTVAAQLAKVPVVVNAISGLGFMVSGAGPAGAVRALAARAFYALCLRHRHQVIVVQNERDRAALSRLRLPRSTAFRHFFGSGVDLARFRPSPPPPGVPVVVLAARMVREKGIFILAEAARWLRSQGATLRVVLCGSLDPASPGGIPAGEIRRLVDEGVVEYWGQRPDMQQVYADAAIVCLPTYYGEGLPLALAEAAASGRPVITTDLPGCRDTVRDGLSGFLVRPRDPADLAEKLGRLLADPELRSKMGAESRRLAEERFAIERVVEGHFEIYDELLSDQNRGRV